VKIIKEAQNIIRISDWWNFIVPPILGWAYLSVYLTETGFNESYVSFLFIFVSITGTAGFGYFLNNWTDIHVDKKAGRPNSAAKLSTIQRLLLLTLLLALSVIPWIIIQSDIIVYLLIVSQIVLLTIYSVPPFRFKKNIWLCLIIDSLYSNVIFSIAVFLFFLDFEFSPVLLILTLFLFIRGLRNILVHQIHDRKTDRKSGIRTFVNVYGPARTSGLINYIILPVESVLLILLTIFLSGYLPCFYITVILFLLFTISKYRLWEKLSLPASHYMTMFHKIYNDLYEEWIPVIFLIYLSAENIYFLIILAIHTGIFYQFILKLIKDCKNITINYLSDFRHAIKLLKK
jgi:4-hydroxybenzoate polyprenyltransferase